MIYRLLALALTAVLSAGAQAHLFPKQRATIKILENGASLVVAVPVSALRDVDDNRDGLLSPREIQAHNDTIREQFLARFHVSCEGAPATSILTWVVPPQTDGPPTDSDYVVLLHRVNFPATPATLAIQTDLFGAKAGESQLTVTAKNREAVEVVTLDASVASHRFSWE